MAEVHLSESDRLTVTLGADLLRVGLTTEALFRDFVGSGRVADEVVALAVALAASRGPEPALAGGNESADAVAVSIAAEALQQGLATPETVAAYFAQHENRGELTAMAVALAHVPLKRAWSEGPPPPLPPLPPAQEPADKSPRDFINRNMAACLTGAHRFHPPDAFGRRTCGSCGVVSVVSD